MASRRSSMNADLLQTRRVSHREDYCTAQGFPRRVQADYDRSWAPTPL